MMKILKHHVKLATMSTCRALTKNGKGSHCMNSVKEGEILCAKHRPCKRPSRIEARIHIINQIDEMMDELQAKKDILIQECHHDRIHDAIVAYLNTKPKSILPSNMDEYIEAQTDLVLTKWKVVKNSSIDHIDPLRGDREDCYHDLLRLGTILDDY